MTSNFTFIQSLWPELFKNAREAEKFAHAAPVTSAFYSRLTLEMAVNWLYENDYYLEEPYNKSLSSLMTQPSFRSLIPSDIYNDLNYIRKTGNNAVHGKKISRSTSYPALNFLFRFLVWFANKYSTDPPGGLKFDQELIPKEGQGTKTLGELKRLQEEFEDNKEELRKERAQRKEIEEEYQKIKEELERVQQIKAQNEYPEVPSRPYSEEETRKMFLDVMLMEAGWDIEYPGVIEYPVTGMPKHVNPSGKGRVDYVLWGDDGLPMALIEAKQTSVHPEKGQHQAKLYADCLEEMKGQRPIIFFSNGFETWLWDDQFYPPRPVQGIYRKEELQLLISRRTTRRDIRTLSINRKIVDRHYQIEAIQRITEDYATTENGKLKGNRRKALVVMATGAGKTRTSAALVDVLMQGNWVKRVLFLADRKALVDQAKRSFKKHMPNLSAIDLTEEEQDDTTRLVFSTYPTIMNRIDDARNEGERYYGVGHFDLVIIDEAHRSIYDKYGAIFEYFDSLYLGLTATPKNEVDHDTYELFQRDSDDPTAAYELNEAVEDGYLVPPKGKSIDLGFMKRGIKYSELSPEEKKEYEETFRDEHGNFPKKIDAVALNRWLYNADTIDKVLAELMENGLRVEGGEKTGKSIIFANSHKHAEEIQKRFNRQFPQYSGHYLQIIDNYAVGAKDLITKFSLPSKYPQIAVSVDMLDTGIDIPEIVNLVFFKPIYSSTKYWQMLGRGTRLCSDLFGPGQDKKYFIIFDFCGNFEFFEQNPEGIEPKRNKSLSEQIFETKIRISEALRQPNYQDDSYINYRISLLDELHQYVKALFEKRDNFRIRARLKYIDPYKTRKSWDNLTQDDITNLTSHVAPLIEIPEQDEAAKRFDLLAYKLQLAYLEDSPEKETRISEIVNIAGKLQKISNIPEVYRRLDTIQTIQKPEFWENSCDLFTINKLRKEIRSLVRLIKKSDIPTIYTNFEDSVDSAVVREDIVKTDSQLKNYRKRVAQYIREHQDNLTIRKIKTNHPITHEEINELENMLFDGDERGTKEDLMEEMGSEQPLGQFIRSIVGLDANAAKEAFSEFLNKANLSAAQMNFINNIIAHLTQNGVIDKSMLFEPPFTDINDQGVFGLFEDKDQDRIFQIIDEINHNAIA